MNNAQSKDTARYIYYLQLMRIDAPAGAWLLLWPTIWSLALASGNTIHLDLYAIFIAGAFLMRSSGCIINDIIDRKIDAKVSRTQKRPLANKSITLFEALLILAILLSAAAFLLWQLGAIAQYLGLAAIVLVILYPTMKRITYWPQLFLGITFNWGILMGWAAVRGELSVTAILLYIAGVLWTLGYDTIYGHQDKQEDVVLGLKSTSIKFSSTNQTRKFLFVVYGISAILLWVMGISYGLGMLYFVTLFLSIAILFWQTTAVDYHNAEHCLMAFKSNQVIGCLLYLGIMGGIWWF